MSFNVQNFLRTAAGEFGSSQVPVDYKYNGVAAGNTKAEIIAADYFLPVFGSLSVGSMLNFTATDAPLTLAVVTASSSSTVTLSEITETLPPGSIDTADLADLCVTTPKIALLAVTNAQMGAGAALANIAAASITGAKIAAATIAASNLAAGAAAGNLTAGEVTNTMLADGAVSGAKIAALGVDAGKYAAASIATADIALLAVTNAQMAAGAALANLAAASVTGAKIAAATITASNLAATVGIKVLSGGGAATAATSTAFTVTGTLATDKAYATMTAGFSQPITGVVCTADTVTVHYAAAALVTDTVDISVFRGG